MDGNGIATTEIELNEEHSDVESRIRKMVGNEEADSETELALAEALFDKGDDAEAIRVLQYLIHTENSCLRAYDRLVDTFTRLGRRKDAAETYRAWGQQLAERTAASAESTVDTGPSEDESSVVNGIARYYAIRAPEYDKTSGYQRSESSSFVDKIRAKVQETVRDRDAIEIACGTGFWTGPASEVARSLLATDRNVELVETVQKKIANLPHVKCQVADAYTLDGVKGPFTAAYAQFWWSHIPRSMIKTFLVALHSRLAENAQVFFMDSLPYVTPGSRRLDAEGNVIEPRVLMNGEKYEVIKNFPTEAELREALEGFADDLQYEAYERGCVWTVSYKARKAA
jgi:hypothetical protein